MRFDIDYDYVSSTNHIAILLILASAALFIHRRINRFSEVVTRHASEILLFLSAFLIISM